MEKALLREYHLQSKKPGASSFSVHFNPEAYTIQSSGRYGQKDQVFNPSNMSSGNLLSFIRREPSVLNLELLFDSFDPSKPSGMQEDVRQQFSLLNSMLVVQPTEHTPSGIQFVWGSLNFVGVLTQLNATYTMFSESGIPVRAKLALIINGCMESELLGVPNESPDRTKLRTLRQKETLWELAEQEYGSGEQWRVIALANGIENPRKVRGASQLMLPALPGGEA